jgi:CheY-like chemotaxis protein
MATEASNLWLVVEDQENDFLLLQRACRRIAPQPTLVRVEDGLKAQQYLMAWGDSTPDRPFLRPALILSDINMPQIDGFELLGWLRKQQWLSTIPFVFVTSSGLQADRDRARELRADGYLVKPSGSSALIELLQWV